MSLTLTVSSSPSGVSVEKAEVSFSDHGGSIGRALDQTMVLPDPERFISSSHAAISYDSQNLEYMVTDRSKNGLFINDSKMPVGSGKPTVLKNNDILRLGRYTLTVSISLPEFSSDKSNKVAVKKGAASSVADPAQVATDFLTKEHQLDPERLLDDIDIALGDLSFGSEPSQPVSKTFVNEKVDDKTGSITDIIVNEASIDPLVAIDQANSKNAMELGIVDDFNHEKLDELVATTSAPDLVEPITPVDVALSNTLTKSKTTAKKLDVKNEPRRTTKVTPTASESREALQKLVAQHKKSKQAENKRPSTQQNRPVLGREAEKNSSAVRPKLDLGLDATPDSPSLKESDTLTDDALVVLGIDPSGLTEKKKRQIILQMAQMTREFVAGLQRVLNARHTVKNELRLGVTTIQPAENNPFKFSVSVDEAIENLFIKSSSAYLEPLNAVKQSYDDLGFHQVALMSGMQDALFSMLADFSPGKLEKQFEEKGKGPGLLTSKETYYWRSYNDYFRSLKRDSNQFNVMFGQEFSKAYEHHMTQLSEAPSAGNPKKGKRFAKKVHK